MLTFASNVGRLFRKSIKPNPQPLQHLVLVSCYTADGQAVKH